MRLVLTVAGGDSREFAGGQCRIGRAADNDWTLPDPERLLSKRHCVVAFDGAEWRLTDFSTNGTFLNGEAEPIGVGGVRELRDGDRLRMGGYEIAVHIAAAVEEASLEDDPFDRLVEADLHAPVQSDHVPAIDEAFAPPRPLLDDDWDAGISPAPPSLPTPVVAAPPAAQPDLLAAFLRGAGLPQTRPANAEATMESLGAAFRTLVSGLRAALVARGAIKSEFRIAPTMLRPRGNNPLKFSAGDDDALAALLGTGRHTDMGPQAAIGEALDDMRRHELATVAAMQAAVRALLEGLAPEKFLEAGGGLLPGQRKARAWDAFAAQHARTREALSDDFESAFGRAFARAYERALAEIGGHR